MSIQLYELGGPADGKGGEGSGDNDGARALARRYSTFSWRTRLALAHKGLEFTTHPVKVSDKATIQFSGQKKVPIIRDGSTVVFDSFKIAEYLESRYPDRPSLFGGDTGLALARFFNSWVDRQLVGTLVPSLMIDNVKRLEPDDAAHLRSMFETGFGKTLEELATGRDQAIASFQKLLDPVRSALRSQPFVAGVAPSYTDYILFSSLQWPRITTTTPILAADDVVSVWFERMLDRYDGMGRKAPAAT